MKAAILGMIFGTGMVFGGTIASPTQVVNGQIYNYSKDTTQNFYTFTLSQKGAVLMSGSATGLYTTGFSNHYFFYDVNLSNYKTIDCGTGTSSNSSKSCTFDTGTYIVQVRGDYGGYEGNVSFYSKFMSDYVAPGCPAPASSSSSSSSSSTVSQTCDTSKYALTKSKIDSLASGQWHLVGTSVGVSDFSIFSSASYIWKYDGNWMKFEPKDTSVYPPQIDINAFDGFWIKK